MDTGDAVLEAVGQVLREGTAPGDTGGIANAAIRQRLEAILSEIHANQQFALALAQGDLAPDLAMKGYMAGSLKTLQANLRHLTWQAQQIAGGDYGQRVRFMGEFSVSFNAMTEQLAREAAERNRREQDLREANTALFREIAEHRRLEQALALTNTKLGLVSGVTLHDIRNKLLVLNAYIGLMREGAGDPAGQNRYLDSMEQTIKIIEGQITFAKDYEDLGVREPAWNNLELIACEAAAGLAFGNVKLEIATGGAEVFADLLIAKVFYNLMDNALRYGGPSMTELTVTAGECPGGGLAICVQDNGAGISAEDKVALFTKGFGKNTGFGLFLSREILSLTGITITEEGIPGSGARFRISVPTGMFRFR